MKSSDENNFSQCQHLRSSGLLRRSSWVGVAALVMLGFQSPSQAADDDWPDYEKRVGESRRESEQRYQNWLREEEKRKQTWRDAQGTDEDRVLEVPDSGLNPGRYTLRLPFGLRVRVNVPDDPQVPKGPSAWGDRTYGDVSHQARQINRQLRDLQLELQRGGRADLTAEAVRIYEKGANVANAAAARRPVAEIRSQFAEFDRLWHPFVHRLAKEPNVSTSVQRRVALLNQMEEGLHQVLSVSPAPPYNRPVVAALTSELSRRTSHLLKDLKIEPQQTLDLHSITLRAQRVTQHAADLHATVARNAPFATIVEEYEEFDRAWHRLLEQARGSPEVEAHVRGMARQVRQVDLQLHQELYVNVPTVNRRQQLLQLSAGVAKTADHLAEDLDADTGRGKPDLLDQARLFASITHDLERVLNDPQPTQAEQRAFREVLNSWQQLDAQLDLLKDPRFEHSLVLAAQLETQIGQLQSQWR